MSRRALFLAALLAASVVWPGCRGPSTSSRPGQGGPQLVRAKATPLSPAQAAEEDKREEDEIRAYTEYATGLIFEEQDDPAAALEHFTASVEADPTFEPLAIEVARRHLQRKEVDQAIGVLQTCAAQPDASALVFGWLGLAHAQADHPEEAIAANLEALRRSRGFLMPYQNLFQLHVQQRQYDQARKLLDEGARTEGTDAVFCTELAQMFAQLARFLPEEADAIEKQQRALLDRALASAPQNILLLERLADRYAELPNAFEPAVELYQKVLARLPNSLPVREKLFRLYLKAGRKEEAAAQLEAIRREQPTNPATYYFLGDLASDEKDYDRAIEHFATALRLNPNFEPVYYELAGVYIMHQQPQNALNLLEKARKRFKGRFLLEYYTGLAHGAKKDYQEAIKSYIAAEVFAKAAEPERLTAVFYFQYGAAYERAGEHVEAERLFKKSLELNPRFPEALNYLGYMWAERGQNLEEARKHIEEALALEPQNGAFLDSMAWVMFQLKRPAEALVWMEKAVALNEEPDATLYDHLGDILAALNRLDDARRAWEKSLEIQTDEKVRRKLDGGHVPGLP